MILESRLKIMRKVDAVVFDCDGVLVDTKASYDVTISKVVDEMIRKFAGVSLPWHSISPDLIGRLRRTGRFNNDWDTTYALTLLALTALYEKRVTGIQSSHANGNSISPIEMQEALGRLVSVVKEFCSTNPISGHEAVNSFVEKRRVSNESSRATKAAREMLGYPGSPPRSLLATLFDEVYHGRRLFKQLYGLNPTYYNGRGLIEDERVLMEAKCLEKLDRLLGPKRLAIATGRPFIPAKYTLGRLLDHFDLEASVFIGDGDVRPELAAELRRFRKPSGESLILARERLSSKTLLYVGDSAEDLMMVENARRSGQDDFLFAGVCGSGSKQEEERLRYFRGQKADLIIRRGSQLPSILEMIRN